MILKNREARGSLHAYGIARRIEQTSGDTLEVPYGTLTVGAILISELTPTIRRCKIS